MQTNPSKINSQNGKAICLVKHKAGFLKCLAVRPCQNTEKAMAGGILSILTTPRQHLQLSRLKIYALYSFGLWRYGRECVWIYRSSLYHRRSQSTKGENLVPFARENKEGLRFVRKGCCHILPDKQMLRRCGYWLDLSSFMCLSFQILNDHCSPLLLYPFSL